VRPAATWAYFQLLAGLLGEFPQDMPLETLAAGAGARFGDPRMLLRHYSGARLRSVEARRSVVAPDLTPLA